MPYISTKLDYEKYKKDFLLAFILEDIESLQKICELAPNIINEIGRQYLLGLQTIGDNSGIILSKISTFQEMIPPR